MDMRIFARVSAHFIWLALASLASCAAGSFSTAQAGLAAGNIEVDLEGSANDTTSSRMVELAFETMPQPKMGGGVRLRAMASDDDLDRNPGDGVPGSGEARDAEWFFHGTFENVTGAARLPFRMGLFLRSFDLEEGATGASLAYATYGPRIEFAPVVPLLERDAFGLSVSGLVGFGYGVATVEDSTISGESETNAGFMDLGIGLRAEFSKSFLDLGYRQHASTYEQSDGATGLSVGEVDATFSGLMLSAGIRF
ncbi:MAG: hypothetical protein RIT24_2715 [Planctomycetota bacterium]